jgi:hypothetical protein
VFLLLALVVNLSLNANFRSQDRVKNVPVTTPVLITDIPDCSQDLYIGDKQCVTFLYTPDNDTVINVRQGAGVGGWESPMWLIHAKENEKRCYTHGCVECPTVPMG